VEEDGLVAVQKISELAGGVREEEEFIRKLPTAIKDPTKYGELLLGTKGVLQTLSESFDTIASLDFWRHISFLGFDASNLAKKLLSLRSIIFLGSLPGFVICQCLAILPHLSGVPSVTEMVLYFPCICAFCSP